MFGGPTPTTSTRRSSTRATPRRVPLGRARPDRGRDLDRRLRRPGRVHRPHRRPLAIGAERGRRPPPPRPHPDVAWTPRDECSVPHHAAHGLRARGLRGVAAVLPHAHRPRRPPRSRGPPPLPDGVESSSMRTPSRCGARLFETESTRLRRPLEPHRPAVRGALGAPDGGAATTPTAGGCSRSTAPGGGLPPRREPGRPRRRLRALPRVAPRVPSPGPRAQLYSSARSRLPRPAAVPGSSSASTARAPPVPTISTGASAWTAPRHRRLADPDR